MQLNNTKTATSCLRRVMREVKEQEETLELRLQDGMPDVNRVIACWGQPVIRSKEWRSSGVCISGGIMAWIMYSPEDGGAFQCIDTWLPFQVKYDFSDYENDGYLIVQPLLHALDARTLSARKLMLRAVVGVSCDAMVDGEFEICTPCDVPSDVQLLREERSFLLPKLAGEKSFRIEEVLNATEIPHLVDKIVYYQASPMITERKVMGDKVIFRGVLIVHILYSDGDGKLSCFDTDLPFSQFVELNGEFSADAEAQVVAAVSSLELERREEGYAVSAGIIGQFLICDKENIMLVEDAYSPKRKVGVSLNSLQLPVVLGTETNLLPVQIEIKDDDLSVMDAVFNPSHSTTYNDEDALVTEFSGTYRVLGYNGDNEFVFKTEKWNDSDRKGSQLPIKCTKTLPVSVRSQVNRSSLGAQISSDMPVEGMLYLQENIPIVTSMEISDEMEINSDRPGLILRKSGGESLWSIAKQTGSTVEHILDANGLQDEPEVDQFLLIPVI